MTADTQEPEEPAPSTHTGCEKPLPAFSGGLFGGTQIVSAPPPPLRVTAPKTPAPPEKEDAPCASVTSGSSEGSATPDGASDEENISAPKLPALETKADEAPADDATPEQAAASDADEPTPEKAEENIDAPKALPAAAEDDEDAAAHAAPENDDAASDDDDKAPEQAATDEDGPTVDLAPAAAEDGEDADENDDAAEDADDATPEKAASDEDSPKPAKIPKPRGRAPQGKAWDPDQGRWATQVDESDDDETLDVMRQRASRSASVEEDVVRPARTESLEDVESRFLGGGATPPQKEQEDEPTPEKTSPEQEKNENTGRWTDDEHARFLRGLELFGKKWSKVADVVQSRTTIQVRSHAQKYLKKFEEESDDDEETLEAMRLKSQDRDYQLKRDEEREKKAQLRARQDLDQLSVKEFAAGDKVDARFGRGWFPGIVEKCIEGGYSIKWDEDSTYNDVLARDVRKRTADDDVSQAARALLAAKDDTILPSSHKVSAETSSEETLRWLDGFETRRWVERLVSSIDDASQQPKDEYAELSNSQLRALMRKNGIGRGSYDTRGDFVRKLRKHGVPPKEEPKEVVVKPVLLDTSKVQVGASVAKRFPGYGVYRGAIEAIDGDDVTVRWDDGDSVTWSRKEAARRVVKEAPTTKKVVKKPARRQPVVRPALVDVDDLLERDVRIQRTSKPRQARFERCTGATSAREYLRLGGQKKDLRYDVSNGFFVEVDVCSGVFCTFERGGVGVRPRRADGVDASRESGGAVAATASTRCRLRGRARVQCARWPVSTQGDSIPFRVKKDDNQLTMDPVVDENESEEEQEERHWVTGIGWKPGPAPAKTASRAERMAISPSSPTSAKNCADYVPRSSTHFGPRFECPAGCGRAFDHAPAAAAHGKACTGEDDGRRRSPVQRGDNKRFPCPAGCARTFDHAPAAAAHGKTCSGSSVIPDDDWAATARSLLREIRGERERNRYANLEELRPALTRCGFSGTPPPWRAGYCGVSTPANFPESSRIRSLAQLVNYLEGALSKGGKAPPPEKVQEADDDVDDQFAAMSSSQLRSAMQSRGIGRGAYDTPVDFRRKLRAYEAKRPRSSDEDERQVKRAKTDDSSSRFTGVSHDKRNGKWYASICHRGAKEQLGAFEQEEEAARAHDEARVRYGKKAVNFPSSSSDDEAEFSVGARVEVRWRKKWYPAVIDAVYDGGGSYEVEWIGDGRFNRVTANSVRAVPASPRSVVEKRGRASSEFCDSDDEVMPAKKIRGSPEGTEKLKAEPLVAQEFELGVRVEAKWNGRYYPASVHRFDKGRYEVMWDDDEGYNWVPAKALRAAK